MLNKKNSVELIKVFNYGESNGVQIRTQVINNQPYFVARDVCTALNITWSGHTLDQIPDSWKGSVKFSTPGGVQNFIVISEAGLYKLAFRCQASKATDRFTNWVAEEVLPSIRKTGKYEVKPRKRTLPRNTRPEMQQFFDELTQWVTLQDEKIVADLMNVTRKHVHEVLRGRIQSYGVMCMLVDCGKENRSKGLRRLVINQPRIKEMEQLRFEFMNNLTVEG